MMQWLMVEPNEPVETFPSLEHYEPSCWCQGMQQPIWLVNKWPGHVAEIEDLQHCLLSSQLKEEKTEAVSSQEQAPTHNSWCPVLSTLTESWWPVIQKQSHMFDVSHKQGGWMMDLRERAKEASVCWVGKPRIMKDQPRHLHVQPTIFCGIHCKGWAYFLKRQNPSLLELIHRG